MDRDDILRKAAALINMTIDRGCTEAEAQTAADKLRTLADAYGLDLGALTEDARQKTISADIAEERVPVPWKRTPRAMVMLAAAVVEGFDCRWFIDALRGQIVFCGFGPDACIAGYLFTVLHRGLPKEGLRIGQGFRLRRRRLTVFVQAFTDGAAMSIKRRLAEQRKTEAEQTPSTALIRVSKAIVVDGYLDDHYNLRSSPRKPPRMSPTRKLGTMCGLLHGKSVPLQAAVGE
jgi:hypothetical protein